MNREAICKYLETIGPFKAFRADGQAITIVSDKNNRGDYTMFEASLCSTFYYSVETYGFTVDHDAPDYTGYYAIDLKVLPVLEKIAVNMEITSELRELLPATLAMVEHYDVTVPEMSRALKARDHTAKDYVQYPGSVKVYALKSRALRQSARGAVIVIPNDSCGMTEDTHRITGYMYNVQDETIKHDSIQAWRMRRLTREELMTFDPKWGDITY